MSIFDINFDDVKESTSKTTNRVASNPSFTKYDQTLPKNDEQFQSARLEPQPLTLIPADLDLFQSGTAASTMSRAPGPHKKNKHEGPRVVQEDWIDKVTCIKANTRHLLSRNFEVVISGHEIVNRNMFMPDYVRYFLSVPALKI